MTPRQTITTALGTVDGVTAYDAEPDVKHEGAAWPVLRTIARDGTFAAPYTRTYDVFVVLPAGYGPTAADAAENIVGPVVEALEDIGEWVQPAETVQIAFDDTTKVPGIRVGVIPDHDDA